MSERERERERVGASALKVSLEAASLKEPNRTLQPSFQYAIRSAYFTSEALRCSSTTKDQLLSEWRELGWEIYGGRTKIADYLRALNAPAT